jgi:hypothetical protein
MLSKTSRLIVMYPHKPPTELPPKYYLDYFRYLLDFVKKKYQPILNENEWTFVHKFETLTEDQQCLFIRFTNRRGAFFRTQKLKYAEIDDIPKVLEVLEKQNFIEKLSHLHTQRAGEALDIFSKTELLALAKKWGLDTKGKASLKKEEVIDWLLENPQVLELDFGTPVVKVNYEAEVMMIKFLFFGSRAGDMTEFVIRDLGYRQYQQFDEEKLVAFFATRQEAEDKLRVSLAREDFYLMQEAQIDPTEVYYWFLDWSQAHAQSLADIARPTYERLCVRVGGFLEKQKLADEALVVFRLTEAPPSRERQVRILYKQKQTDEARALCQYMLETPQNADEQFFAIDFLNKLDADGLKKRSRKATTQQLIGSESVMIDAIWKHRVEMGVIDYFEQQDTKAIHAENYLWRSLFGLLFWDIIFDTDSLAIHHPLQRSPSDFYKPIFWEKRRNKLVQRLDLLDDTDETLGFVQNVFLEKLNTTNPLVEWFPGLWDWLVAMLKHLPKDALKAILLEMAKNMRENTRGFPDLFTWTDTDYGFVEVKSPTDHLSNQQLFWLRFFEQVGIKSKVLRVEWFVQNLEELT